jgi:hypothetical protein
VRAHDVHSLPSSSAGWIQSHHATFDNDGSKVECCLRSIASDASTTCGSRCSSTPNSTTTTPGNSISSGGGTAAGLFSLSCALEFHQEAVKFIALGFGCDDDHTHWFHLLCTNRGVSQQEKEAWRIHFFERTTPATQGNKPRRGHDTPWIAGKGSLKKLVQCTHLLVSLTQVSRGFASKRTIDFMKKRIVQVFFNKLEAYEAAVQNAEGQELRGFRLESMLAAMPEDRLAHIISCMVSRRCSRCVRSVVQVIVLAAGKAVHMQNFWTKVHQVSFNQEVSSEELFVESKSTGCDQERRWLPGRNH